MNINSFEQHFHPSWWVKLKPFLESKDFENIWNKIKELGTKNRKVYPYSKLLKEEYPDIENTIFKPFKFDFNTLEVLIFSELSNNFTKKPFGTILDLDNYYNTIEKSVYNGLNLNMIRTKDLSYLENQGIMILGNSLTSEVELSHYPIWEPLMKYVMDIINTSCRGLHVILLGNNTHKYSKILDDKSHYIYKSDINYSNFDMFNIISERMLKNQNKIINWCEETTEEIPF